MVVANDRQRKVRKADLKRKEKEEEKKERELKGSPYKKWTQVNNSREAYEAEDWLISNSPTAYRILKFLVSNMDRVNAVICSYKVMQEKLRLSRTTVADAIKFLKEHKFIDAVRTGGSNIYMVNKMLYWNSWGSNYAYAEFEAKVIISSSEQDNETKEEIKLQIKRRTEIELKTKGADQAGQTELILENQAS